MSYFQRKERVASYRAHGFIGTIPLNAIASLRHVPRRVLQQPQRPRPIKRRHRPAATLDSLNIDSLTHPLALTPPSTQLLENLRRAYRFTWPSIVISRPKSLERTSSRRRPPVRATIVAKACHLSRTLVATPINNLNRLVATGHSALSDQLCPPCQFISRQAPRPIAPRATATLA